MKLITAACLAAAAFFAGLSAFEEESGYRSALVEGVPHVRQRPDFCGEACAEMVLRKLGRELDQDDVFSASGVDPAAGRGARTKELAVALERLGFRTGPVWLHVPPDEESVEARWRELHLDLTRGVPSIVCMRYDDSPGTTEHFRLVLGYDAEKDEVVYHEPAVEKGAYLRMARGTFQRLWPLKYEEDRWLLVRFRLEPGEAKERPRRDGAARSDADFAQHVRELRKRLPHDGFTIVVERPFVVIGDEVPARVRARAERTVQWAVTLLKEAFFPKDPLHILDVWLFKDKASYEKHALKLFGSRPHTLFGWYSAANRALIMNIATGGGTLVHEIVHPFVEANFPDCPPWFNEGLGSLFEACHERHGEIRGLTNWRLKGLKEAIRAKGLPPFERLAAMDSAEFYGGGRGDNYAQARYLLYHLQEKGLLRRYYREFHENREKDPTGYETLVRILGEKDMAAFQERWEAWVLTLEYP